MAYSARLREEQQRLALSITKLVFGCQECGYNREAASLSFHHRAGEDKVFTVGRMGMTRSNESIRAEIDKCDLLCCNCHMEVTHGTH